MPTKDPELLTRIEILTYRLRDAVRGNQSRIYSPEQRLAFAQIFEQLLEASRYTVPQLARKMDVASQTANRWRSGKSLPRLSQLNHLEAVLLGKPTHEVRTENSGGPDDPSRVAVDSPTPGVHLLGIRTFEEVLNLEMGARRVWVMKNGILREAIRGHMADCLLRALKNNVHFHYIFSRGTPAEASFREQLMPWLNDETFSGSVTGYCVNDNHHAYDIGLSNSPGAWVAIEFSEPQIQTLNRPWDVFKAIGVREYTDSARSRIKNEDGQACWLEISGEAAWKFYTRLTTRSHQWATTAQGSKENEFVPVEIIRIAGKEEQANSA